MTAISLKHKKIAVIGLGYVGLPLAVEFGKKRLVTGFDTSKSRIDELKRGVDRTLECSTEELNSSQHLTFTNTEEHLDECGIFIVTVPTPVNENKQPDFSSLNKASEIVARNMKMGDVVIYESTVFPGATEEICLPIIEKISNLKLNEGFFCGYSPERINPGDKLNTLTKIPKVVSGSTPEIADEIEGLYSEIITAGTFKTSSIKVAEASKVIENTQRDLNIAFVNELSVIFERLDIDTSEVLRAAGTKWNFIPFRPGIVGGHCIGVDPYYLTYKAEQIGYRPQIILAGRRMNDNMARYSARNIIKKMTKGGTNIVGAKVLILGVTFKEDCPDVRNSKVFDMIKEFEAWGIDVDCHDPWANKKEVYNQYGVHLCDFDSLGKYSAVIIAVSHSEFRNLDLKIILSLFNGTATPVLGDLKAIYGLLECQKLGLETFRL